jgi:hypothetical protein
LVSIDTSEVTIADAGTRAVLRRGAIGHVQVDVVLLQEVAVDAEADARERTTDSAADADSFITSPSWPVRISWPLPGTSVDSICSRSPPTSVQARPVTRPISFFLGTAEVEATHAQVLVQVLAGHAHQRLLRALLRLHRLRAGQRDLLHHLAADLGDLAFQVAHARFARVVAHDVADRIAADLQLFRLQAVGLDLLGHQVALAMLSFSSSV